MIVGPPPLEVELQVLGRLSKGPGFAHERSDTAAEGEVDALDESGLNVRGKALSLQELIEKGAGTSQHSCYGEDEFAPSGALNQLAIV